MEQTSQFINYENQCFEETGDQESTAISLDKAKRILDKAEAYSKKVLHKKVCEDIPKSKQIFDPREEQYLTDADQSESFKSIIHENKSWRIGCCTESICQNWPTRLPKPTRLASSSIYLIAEWCFNWPRGTSCLFDRRVWKLYF